MMIPQVAHRLPQVGLRVAQKISAVERSARCPARRTAPRPRQIPSSDRRTWRRMAMSLSVESDGGEVVDDRFG